MMKPHNDVILKLPFRIGGFLSIRVWRKIGFVFDNHTSAKVFIESKCQTAEEYEDWSKIDGGGLRNFEFLYQAAVRYNELIRKPDKFTRVSLKKALSDATEDQIQLLTECVQRSEMFGAIYDKKKVAKKAQKKS